MMINKREKQGQQMLMMYALDYAILKVNNILIDLATPSQIFLATLATFAFH
jgi:hypothetical protein